MHNGGDASLPATFRLFATPDGMTLDDVAQQPASSLNVVGQARIAANTDQELQFRDLERALYVFEMRAAGPIGSGVIVVR